MLGPWSPARATIVYIFDYSRTLPLERGEASGARPEAVTVDPATGDICVTEAAGSTLQIFNGRGALLFRTGLLSGLSSPASGSLDADGNFVCTDTDSLATRTIRRLDLRGEPLPWRAEPPRPDWSPVHLTITSDGNYVTLDPGAGLLAKHDARTGALLWQRRLGGERAGELGLGRPCEGPDRRLYVPGGELHSVLVLSPEGEQVAAFGELGSTLGGLIYPVGVAPGPRGTMAVLDRMRHKLLLFDSDFTFRAEFGAMGAGPGEFYHPLALATAPEAGLAYVAQGFEGRVQVFRLLGLDTADAPAGAPGAGTDAAASAGSPAVKGAAPIM
ncbi:MAG: NHL repeat-containing protein [Candidatus Krumholzibacteriia bacterium]